MVAKGIMMSAEDKVAYEMQMLEISDIMPDKSTVNIDLGQLDFDENILDNENLQSSQH